MKQEPAERISFLQTKLQSLELSLASYLADGGNDKWYITCKRQNISQTRRRLREANAGELLVRKPPSTAKRRLLEKLANTERELERVRADNEFLKRTIESLNKRVMVQA